MSLQNAKQVASRLGISWRTLLRLADDGKFPWGLKVGGARRWNPETVEEWIKEQTANAGK